MGVQNLGTFIPLYYNFKPTAEEDPRFFPIDQEPHNTYRTNLSPFFNTASHMSLRSSVANGAAADKSPSSPPDDGGMNPSSTSKNRLRKLTSAFRARETKETPRDRRRSFFNNKVALLFSPPKPGPVTQQN